MQIFHLEKLFEINRIMGRPESAPFILICSNYLHSKNGRPLHGKLFINFIYNIVQNKTDIFAQCQKLSRKGFFL